MTSSNHKLAIPTNYWVTTTKYRCKRCEHEFDWRWAEGGEIVKFINSKGDAERWLPTYGPGGYLDLLKDLVPGFQQEQEINFAVARQFHQALLEVQRDESVDARFVVDERPPTCPSCMSHELLLVSRNVEKNPSLIWLNLKTDSTSSN